MLCRAAFLLLFVFLSGFVSAVSGQGLGACWVGDECIMTTWEECWELCGCYCAEATCDEMCFCDYIPDADLSSALPWDEYGHALVTPGAQSAVGEVVVLALYEVGSCQEPVEGADVEIDLSQCSNLCVDPVEDGLSGITGPDGSVTLNPRVGGCEDCVVLIRAHGVAIAAYLRVVSTDWDGSRADGKVAGADFAFFATAFKQTQDTCADYNGDGVVSGPDFAILAASFASGDANQEECP